MVRWCWVNFQSRGVLLIWIRVGQGPPALAVCAGGGCLVIFSLVYHFYFLSPSLWETARYRLKYCFKGPLSPKQPTSQSFEDTNSVTDMNTNMAIYYYYYTFHIIIYLSMINPFNFMFSALVIQKPVSS